ncbi:DUF1553 domain-containing protein [Paludisphaera soli]|uniref:DUF1553 domain-containing protein n=1 Tax=Paludisphaera soli TaxID=2712865 RepID=UPI0013EACFBC|nr:DUF1553 domain-containing protein [Paludisphaera soli]
MPLPPRLRSVPWISALVLSGACVNPEARGDGAADYLARVKPILKEHCYACHGALKAAGGLRLDTGRAVLKGGDGGPAVEPGSPDESPLLERVLETDEALRMPLEAPALAPEKLAALREWVAAGAPSPDGEEPERSPRDHWSFRPLARPPVPATADLSWAANPVDAFVAAGHAAHDLSPRPPADRATLLRRVSLDLSGLPPTPEEQREFLADESPDAYGKVVDRLLASPRYGERWGRHWMDVWRYSDWFGRRMVPDVWNSAPQIWRWRDWIVRSLNDDKGYDLMVREMLAADEIAPEDDEAAVATGFLIRNWYALNPNQWMRENVEHTAKAFLGLTFNCAHCHDHKYDPIRHDDYFRLRAFFEPIGIRQDRVVGQADPGPFQEYDYLTLRKVVRLGAVRIFDKTADAPTWFYTGGDERNRVEGRGAIEPGVPAFLGEAPPIRPVELAPVAFYPGLRPAVIEAEAAACREAARQAESDLARAVEAGSDASPELTEELARAEADLEAAFASAEAAGAVVALEGRQSLILDATTGRRILHNGVKELGPIRDGTTLSFRLMILSDAHVNFQLARDVTKGLTAGYIGFNKGRIVAYRPGGFVEFDAGRYDFKAGQSRFDVRIAFEPGADRGLLTVVSTADGATLVEGVPIAINAWNPAETPGQAITLDAQAGSVAAFDAIEIAAPDRVVRFDFERPKHAIGDDVIGGDGWSVSPGGSVPATSLVSIVDRSGATDVARRRVEAAQRAVEARELPRASAEARLIAARSRLASLEARVSIERAKHGLAPAEGVTAEAASRAERQSDLDAAEAKRLEGRLALIEAEARPADDKARGAKLAEAGKLRDQAEAALAKARAALVDPAAEGRYTPLSPVYPKQSTGRRRSLADWIVGRENPLTARVAINHIWARHFHAPLVATVFDFGRNGADPTHPELLDWLAAELVDSGWSMKRIHRLIVTSRTYCMSSAQGDAADLAARDPENAFLWRMNPGRMEAEAVRDSLLACAGVLDETMGGQELENSEAPTSRRRGLYFSCHPESGGKSEFGAIFDAPDANECYRRTRSVVPQQALALTNNPLIHELSVRLAAEVGRAEPTPGRVVAALYERILSRAPTDAERDVCLGFLDSQAERLRDQGVAEADARGRAREALTRALFNHNDFLTIR